MTETIPLSAGIRLFSGVMFDYTKPADCEVAIDDIAHGLSNICRFAGQSVHFYSVAQHAVNASHIVDQHLAFDALMHDTAEAFTNDLPRPMKMFIPGFKAMEANIESAMAERFGFSFPLPQLVRLADDQMLKLEKEALLPNDISEWQVLDYVGSVAHLRDRVDLTSWHPKLAKAAFLARFEEVRP